jgi:hypothetical protein
MVEPFVLLSEMEERNELEGIDLYAEGSAYPAVKLAVPHGDNVTRIRLSREL